MTAHGGAGKGARTGNVAGRIDPVVRQGGESRSPQPNLEEWMDAMRQSTRIKAEAQFAASTKKDKQTLKDKEKAWQEMSERVARQRALREARAATEADDTSDAGDGPGADPKPAPRSGRG